MSHRKQQHFRTVTKHTFYKLPLKSQPSKVQVIAHLLLNRTNRPETQSNELKIHGNLYNIVNKNKNTIWKNLNLMKSSRWQIEQGGGQFFFCFFFVFFVYGTVIFWKNKKNKKNIKNKKNKKIKKRGKRRFACLKNIKNNHKT